MPPNAPPPSVVEAATSLTKPIKPYFFYGHRKPTQNRPTVRGGLFTNRKILNPDILRRKIPDQTPFDLSKWDPDVLPTGSIEKDPSEKLFSVAQNLSPIARYIVDSFRKHRQWCPSVVTDLNKLRRVTPKLVTEVLKVPDVDSRVSTKFFHWAGKQKGYRHDFACYNALFYCLNRTSQFRAADQVPELMHMQGKPPSEKQFEILLRMHADAGRGLRVYYVYEKMKKFGVKPRVFLYNRIMGALVKNNHLDLAMSVYKDFKEDRLTEESVTFTILIKGSCKVGKIDEAIELLGCMRENLCKPDVFVYTALVKILVGEGNLDGCLRIWKEMKKDEVEPDVMAYGTLVRGLCQGNQVQQAYHVIKEMKEKGHLIDRSIYRSLIEAFVIEGNVSAAVDLLQDLMASGYRADLAIYNFLIKGLCSAKQVDKAFKLFQVTIQEDLQPDFSTVNPILVSKAASFQKISLMTMCVRWPRLLNPTQLSQIIRQQKNPLKALEIFREARTRYPNYHHNGSVYSVMIKILENSGRTTEMKKIISEMKEDSCHCQDSVFAAAIKTYSRAGLLDEAVYLFKSLPQFNCVQWTESFNSLLEILVKESKLEDAYRLFLDHSCGWELKSRTRCLNILMEALCQINRSDLALIIFQEMYHQCCNPDRQSYRILMKGLCQDGHLNEATHLLYSMFWRISQKGGVGDVSIYRIFLDALCDNGEIDEAVTILDKVLRKGLKAPKRYRKQLDLNGCYHGSSADIARVKMLINGALIRGGIPSTDSYKAMAIDFYSEGNIDEGNKVLEEMQISGFKPLPLIYEAKVSALCREGRIDDAMAVIEVEMKEKNCVPSVNIYNTVMKGLCDEKRSVLALRYLEKMCRQVGCVPNHDSYAILVNGLCNEGKYVEASEKLEEMSIKSYWLKDGTYDKVIQGLCLMGRSYKSVMWLEEMISQAKTPQTHTWDALVSSFCASSVSTEYIFNLDKLIGSSW